MIRFTCQDCGQWITAPQLLAGQEVHCTHCQAALIVPTRTPGSEAMDQFTVEPLTDDAMAQAVQESQEEEEFATEYGDGLVITMGLVAALGAGGVWAAVVIITGWPLGYIAVAVGLVVGFVMKDMARPSMPWLGRIAIVITVVGLVTGKVIIVQWGSASIAAGNVIEDVYLLHAAVEAHMRVHKTFAEQTQLRLSKQDRGDLTFAERKSPTPLRPQVHREIRARIESLSEASRWKIAQWYLDASQVPVPRPRRAAARFSCWDILWLALAILLAWRVCSDRRNSAEMMTQIRTARPWRVAAKRGWARRYGLRS